MPDPRKSGWYVTLDGLWHYFTRRGGRSLCGAWKLARLVSLLPEPKDKDICTKCRDEREAQDA